MSRFQLRETPRRQLPLLRRADAATRRRHHHPLRRERRRKDRAAHGPRNGPRRNSRWDAPKNPEAQRCGAIPGGACLDDKRATRAGWSVRGQMDWRGGRNRNRDLVELQIQPASGRTRNQHRPIFEAVEASAGARSCGGRCSRGTASTAWDAFADRRRKVEFTLGIAGKPTPPHSTRTSMRPRCSSGSRTRCSAT